MKRVFGRVLLSVVLLLLPLLLSVAQVKAMPSLDQEIRDAVTQLRREVAPGPDADLAEVWRMPGKTTAGVVPAGGAGVGKYGTRVSESTDPTKTSLQRQHIATYPTRIAENSGGENEFGDQNVTVGKWTLEFNWDDNPDIRGGDQLLIPVVERPAGVTIRKVWQATTAYAVGDVVQPIASNGRSYRAKTITTGLTGATQPTWPTATGATIVDGGVTWELVGRLRTFEVVYPGGHESFEVTRDVGCEEITT